MNTAVEKKTELQLVCNTIEAMQDKFAATLPAHIKPEKFVRVALTAVQNNPQVVSANRTSLYAACAKAAQDGLVLDGREAALVTFRTKNGEVVQYMPMVAGILKKARNSGEIAMIHASVVYEKELSEGKFRYWVDTEGQHIEHTPILFGERGKAVGAYAMAKTKDGTLYVEPMPMADIEKIRSVSRAKDSGPWVTWWDEMAKKSAIRRLSKRLPSSSDIEHTLHADDDLFMPEPKDVTPVQSHPATPADEADPANPKPAEPKKPRKTRAADAVAAAAAAKQAPKTDADGVVIEGEYTEAPEPDPAQGDGPVNGEAPAGIF